MTERPPPPAECANCGADIPPRAQVCPECGADERTGWREQDIYDGLDLPASAWDGDEARAERPTPRINGITWYWWLAGAALLALLIPALIGLF